MSKPKGERVCGEQCQRCGVRYDTIYRVPPAVWHRILPAAGEAGLLCLPCCEELARKAGLVLHWDAAVGQFPYSSEMAKAKPATQLIRGRARPPLARGAGAKRRKA